MDTQNTKNSSTIDINTLDQVCTKAVEESVIDYLKRAVSSKTTVFELIQVLSHQKIAENVQDLPVKLAQILVEINATSTPKKVETPVQSTDSKIQRHRITEAEENKVLQALSAKGSEGMRRSDIVAVLARKGAPNMDVQRLGYTLKKLEQAGRVSHMGEKKGTTWFSSGSHVKTMS